MTRTRTAVDSSVRLLLVRHGETPHNAAGRCQGQLDVPMQDIGEQQARRLATRLTTSVLDAVDAVYSSPLLRAKRTAQLLMGDRDCPCVEAPELMELHYGSVQGLAEASWPTGLRADWRRDPWRVVFPNGESLSLLQARVHRVLRQVTQAHAGQTVMLSTHGLVLRVLLQEALGLTDADFWRLRIPNASAWWMSCCARPDKLALGDVQRAEPRVTVAAAQAAMADKTMPLGAMGEVERVAVQAAVVQQTVEPMIGRVGLCIFAADHGIAAEGVSAYPAAVTAEMTRNFARGGAAINVLARTHDIALDVVDVGVDATLETGTDVVAAKVARGTSNFRRAPAMSADMLGQALAVGADRAQRMLRGGVDVLALGEMGIGNTSSAAALLSAMTGLTAEYTVGAGTGVHGERLLYKRAVVDDALAWHRADLAARGSSSPDAREWLRRVGGLEIAAMAGAAMFVAQHPVLLLVDGFICTVAVLAAVRMLHQSSSSSDGASALLSRLVLSHRSSEKGHLQAIRSLNDVHVDLVGGAPLRPLLDLGMRLGEGSGAAMAVPLLRSATALMRQMATFSDAGVSTALT
jgi:nicotinate-nucleotide--dimethylbenzimidazole phosphoribosyltransferase